MHFIFDIDSLDLPRITVAEPIIRNLDLETVFNYLLEDSIIVSNPIAPGWIVQSRKRIHKASGQSAQPSIP